MTIIEDFCRVKMMLNHPHRQLQDLLSMGGPGGDTVCSTYQEAYGLCCDHCDGQHIEEIYS